MYIYRNAVKDAMNRVSTGASEISLTARVSSLATILQPYGLPENVVCLIFCIGQFSCQLYSAYHKAAGN